MECHPWFEVSDRRKIRFRNVQIKVLLVFEQGRSLQVSISFDNIDQFGPVSTSFHQFRPVLTSLDWFIGLLITSKIQYFWGGSLLLPTSVLGRLHTFEVLVKRVGYILNKKRNDAGVPFHQIVLHTTIKFMRRAQNWFLWPSQKTSTLWVQQVFCHLPYFKSFGKNKWTPKLSKQLHISTSFWPQAFRGGAMNCFLS